MATLTLTVPDQLAKRLEPFSRWLPSILEISLLKLKTPTAEAASEVIDFLASNPSVEAVRNYRASDRASRRTSDLLERNQAGVLTDAEAKELDEMMELEQLIRRLKNSLQQAVTK